MLSLTLPFLLGICENISSMFRYFVVNIRHAVIHVKSVLGAYGSRLAANNGISFDDSFHVELVCQVKCATQSRNATAHNDDPFFDHFCNEIIFELCERRYSSFFCKENVNTGLIYSTSYKK